MKKNPKVGILSNRLYRSPRLLAEGLQRMMDRLGVQSRLYLDGVDWIERSNKQGRAWKGLLVSSAVRSMENWLATCDVIIVCWYSPNAFYDKYDPRRLREYGVPILQYAVYFVGGSEYWVRKLPPGSIERFDGYLVASAVHRCPLVTDRPVFQIGMDLSPAQTFSGSRDSFRVMLDFPREGYEEQREIQSAVARDLGLDFVELKGEYTFREVENLYRQVSLGFVSSFEAFGVPIVQLQNYGALVASPDPNWVSRHALVRPGTVLDDVPDPLFSSNFLFYQGYDDLRDKIVAAQREYDPYAVKAQLLNTQPQLVEGDLATLWEALRAFA